MRKIVRGTLICFYSLLIFLGCEFFLVALSFAFGAGQGGKFSENLLVIAILNGGIVVAILMGFILFIFGKLFYWTSKIKERKNQTHKTDVKKSHYENG